MKQLIAVLIAVVCIGVNAGQTKEQKLNKQIAVLESKNFALKNENKKLKIELQKKNKAIQALAMRIAGQPVKSKATTSSRKYNQAEAQRKAAKLAAEQQKKLREQERIKNLKVVQEKIKYYQSLKKQSEEKIAAEYKKIKDAKYQLMSRGKRVKIIKEAKEKIKEIEREMTSVDWNISQFKQKELSYK